MNRALIERTIAAMDKGYMGHNHAEYAAVMTTLKAELAKPEPEPAAYMLTTRNFGLGGETWDTTEYRDYPWDSDCVPLYAAPTEPHCKFPTCHSQEYQNKLVQEILDEPYGYVSEHRWLIGDNSHEFHFKLETIYQNNCTSITPVYTKGTTNA